MGSPKKIKSEKIDKFQDYIGRSKAIVIADYKGLTVHEMEDLRLKLRESGGRAVVIKNTLAKVALNNLGYNGLDDDLNGQIAFIFSIEDAVAGTKIASDFARKTETFKIVAGLFNGKRISLDEVRALANMPSMHELRSRFVGVLMAPMAEFVGTLQAPVVEFLGTLEAYAKKLEEAA
jgi:large subunit ribosomal protein L10